LRRPGRQAGALYAARRRRLRFAHCLRDWLIFFFRATAPSRDLHCAAPCEPGPAVRQLLTRVLSCPVRWRGRLLLAR
jgi:hypothetical protein